MDALNISRCNVSQIIGESSRFVFHVLLVHISTCIIRKEGNIFDEKLFQTIMITFMAIVLYHLLFRKTIEPQIEKMKLICYDGHNRIKKKNKINKV
jgi:hypothetical protein